MLPKSQVPKNGRIDPARNTGFLAVVDKVRMPFSRYTCHMRVFTLLVFIQFAFLSIVPLHIKYDYFKNNQTGHNSQMGTYAQGELQVLLQEECLMIGAGFTYNYTTALTFDQQ